MKKLYSFLLVIVGFSASAQNNITGTWHGIMDDEYLQVNVTQKGNELCGYTYDYMLNDKSSFCKAKFEGYYDPESEMWSITGVGFFANSGSHILMRMKFWRDPQTGGLRGMVNAGGRGISVNLRKASNKPLSLPASVPPCFAEDRPNRMPPVARTRPNVPTKANPPSAINRNKPAPKPANPPVAAKPVPKPSPKPAAPKPTVPKPAPPVASRPTPAPKPAPKPATPPVATVIVPKPQQSTTIASAPSITDQMKARNDKEQGKIAVTDTKVNIKIYDNGKIDGDIVSVFFNGKLLAAHQQLSEKPLEFNLTLDENRVRQEVKVFAENLGEIPPNTCLIVVTVGGKKYELGSSANLNENAVLVFEYKKP